ncbi:MAG: hypothetical protein ACI865_000647 [Flavobacteriaceae bacterium]|jgi:hypothetical protein
MENYSVKMSDVVNREWPDFVIEYKRVDSKEINHFPGSLLTFSYLSDPQLADVHCDIFTEFRRTRESNELLAPGRAIPKLGRADMWIVSELNKSFHFENLYLGKKCFLFLGDDIVAEGSVTKVYRELKIAQ